MNNIIIVNLADHPILGVKRKAIVTELIIKPNVIEMIFIIRHYQNNDGEYGDEIQTKSLKDIAINKNTYNSYIDLNTMSYVDPISFDPDDNPVFPDGINGVPELDVLRMSQVYAGILSIIQSSINSMVNRGNID
jgi:hypothetical protein